MQLLLSVHKQSWRDVLGESVHPLCQVMWSWRIPRPLPPELLSISPGDNSRSKKRYIPQISFHNQNLPTIKDCNYIILHNKGPSFL